jgi:hypothetical protein
LSIQYIPANFFSETNSWKMLNWIFLLFMQQVGIQGNESFLFVIFLITFQFLRRMSLKRPKLICSLLYFLSSFNTGKNAPCYTI